MFDESFIVITLPDLRKLLEIVENGSWTTDEVITEFFADIIESDLDVLADATEES